MSRFLSRRAAAFSANTVPPAVPALLGLLLAAGAILVLASPAPEAQAAPVKLVWHAGQATLVEGQGHLNQGEAWVGHVLVQRRVLRDLTATLTWTDDVPGSAPDNFSLELVPPPPLFAGDPQEGDRGKLQATVPIYHAAPQGPPPSSPFGAGEWMIRVYLRDAGDGTTLGVLPGQPDNGNPFQVRVDARTWEPGPAPP